MNQVPLPDDRLYTRDDLWVQREDDVYVVGITDYGQNELGELVLVELTPEGETLNNGAPLAVVESVKSVSELAAPLEGEIVEVNHSVEENPSIVNDSPLESGWLLKIKPSHPVENGEWLRAEDYARWRKL